LLDPCLTILSTPQPPDILIVTETKLKSQPQKQWLHRLFTGYTVKHTTHPNASKAGVLIAVSKTLTELGELEVLSSPAELNGFLIHASLRRPNSTPVHLVAMYCPHQMPTRKELYKHVSQLITDARTNQDQMLIAGDFNAVVHQEDRVSGKTPADTLH
jgi:exonuclease III